MKVRHVNLHPDEWLVGTTELDNATRGLYITACCLIYSGGGPITRDRLRAACRDHGHAFSRQLETLVALGKLTINDGQISNKRSIKELQKAEERTAKAQQNGSKGGRPTKENNEVAKPDGSENEKLTTNHEPLTTNHNIIEIAKAISPPSPRLRDQVFDEDFELWWRAVPRKVGKDSAKIAYAKARRKKGASASELLDGIRRFAEIERSNGTEERFIKHPTAWLNAGRWQDVEGIDYGHARRDVPSDDLTPEKVLAAYRERERGMAR